MSNVGFMNNVMLYNMYVILKFEIRRDREKNGLLHNHGLRRRVNEAAAFPVPGGYLFRISGRITFLYEGLTRPANTSRQSDRIKTWNITGVSLSPARSYVKMNKISVSCARGSHGSRSRPVSRIWFRTFLAYKSAGKLGNKSLRARFRICGISTASANIQKRKRNASNISLLLLFATM